MTYRPRVLTPRRRGRRRLRRQPLLVEVLGDRTTRRSRHLAGQHLGERLLCFLLRREAAQLTLPTPTGGRIDVHLDHGRPSALAALHVATVRAHHIERKRMPDDPRRTFGGPVRK